MQDGDEQLRFDPPQLHLPGTDTGAAVMFGAALPALGLAAALGGLGLGLVAAGASIAGGIGLLAYPYQRRRLLDARQRWRARRALRSGDAPTPLGKVTPGPVIIAGRVEVLRAVPGPDEGPDVAAWVDRAWVRRACECSPKCTATFWSLRTRSRTGRFAIVDETGVAVIDGALLDLFTAEQPLGEGGFVALRHGDVVRAHGHAELVEAPDVAAHAIGSYRERGRPVGLSATDDAPILILSA